MTGTYFTHYSLCGSQFTGNSLHVPIPQLRPKTKILQPLLSKISLLEM